MRTKQLSRIRTAAVVATAIALFAPAVATAAPPLPLVVTVQMAFTGPNSAAGTFDLVGAVNDSGAVVQEHSIAGRTVQGVKTLMGSRGNVVIRFEGVLTPTGPTTAIFSGRWAVVGGTGAYDGLSGGGVVLTRLNFASGTLSGAYLGQAHADPR